MPMPSPRKRVILVGHCGPDSSYLAYAVRRAVKDVELFSADDEQSLNVQLQKGADLVLLNRVLDYGFPEELGADLVARLRRSHPEIRLMLISNHDEAQE